MKSSFLLMIPLLALMPTCVLYVDDAWADPREWCDHQLFPLRATKEGKSTWTYNAGSVNATTTLNKEVISVIPINPDTAVAILNTSTQGHDPVPPIALPSSISCTPDGLSLKSPDNFIIPLPFNRMVAYTLIDQNGVFLPPYDQIETGSSWQAYYEFEIILVGRKGNEIASVIQIIMESTVIGRTMVTVPAGTFDALEIQQNFTITPKDAPFSVAFMRSWFLAENVGPVMQAPMFAEPLQLSVELTDYFLP